jgi:glycosyltransferase involved in cell wall biosynthesis
MPTLPLVTCIMPTADRPRFWPRAVEYFLRQEYPHAELIVIDDGAEAVGDLLPTSDAIRHIRLPARASIGEKRNLACEEARGEIIVHWDDDDWQAPHRLRYQVEALQASGAEICGINTLLFYDVRTHAAWQYAYPAKRPAWLAGSTLCYTRSLWQRHPFADIDEGEDARFVWGAAPDRILTLPDPTFHVGIIHDRNASPKRFNGSAWRPFPVEQVQAVIGADWPFYQPTPELWPADETSEPPLADRASERPLTVTLDPGSASVAPVLAIPPATTVAPQPSAAPTPPATLPQPLTASDVAPGTAATSTLPPAVSVSAAPTCDVAVVVTCHGPYLNWLPEALASIDRQLPGPVERIVALDGCEPPQGLDPRWRCIVGAWGHPAGGRNAGLAATDAPWLVFWDVDNIAPPGYLAAIEGAIRSAAPGVAILYPDIQHCDEQLRPTGHVTMPTWDYWSLRAENYVDTAAAWRREALDLVGGWSDRTGGNFEDHALALDITAAGWQAARLDGPAIMMRGHTRSRTEESWQTGSAFDSVWKARTLGIVTLLAGRASLLDRWAGFLLEATLPPKTALYVVDNSGDAAFHRRVIDVCDRIADRRGLTHVDLSRSGLPYRPDPNERYFVRTRHVHVARLYANILPRVAEDLVLTLEDDVEPPRDAIERLGREIGFASRGRIGAVGAAYSMPDNRSIVCAGMGTTVWGISPTWQDLPHEPMDVGCIGGGCTIWANWALRSRPVSFDWELGLGWDGSLCVGLHQQGYRVRLHGDVRCQHHVHGSVTEQ